MRRSLPGTALLLGCVFVACAASTPAPPGPPPAAAAPADESGPAIQSVWGRLAPGASVRVVGERFGENALRLGALSGPGGWIETGAKGRGFEAVPKASGWDVGASSIPAVLTDERAHSGRQSLLARIVRSDGYWQSVLRYTHRERFERLYVSFWIWFDPIVGRPSGAQQWKWWRVNDRGTVDPNDCAEIYFGSRWTGDTPVESQVYLWCLKGCEWPAMCRCYEGIVDRVRGGPICDPCEGRYLGACDERPLAPRLPRPRTWCRVEIELRAGGLDESDGALRMTMQPIGERKTVVVDWEGLRTHDSGCCQDESDPWRHFLLQNYWDDDGQGFAGSRADFFYDDIFLQVGGGARVELGDAPRYEDCTQLEVQRPSRWTDGEIVFEFNPGGFEDAQRLYLHVIDAAGRPGARGFPVQTP